MKPISEMSAGELAAFIYGYLKEHGIEVVLSGGACVTIYSQNKYFSPDLDFIEFGSTPRKKLKNLLGKLGFFDESGISDIQKQASSWSFPLARSL